MTAPLIRQTPGCCPRQAPGCRHLLGPGEGTTGTSHPSPSLPQQESSAPPGPGHTPATTYLAPDLVDDRDEQQDAAQGEKDVLGVVQHLGHQHQLGVECLKRLALHGSSLGRENDRHISWGHTQLPLHSSPPPPKPVGGLHFLQGHTKSLHFPDSLAVGMAM